MVRETPSEHSSEAVSGTRKVTETILRAVSSVLAHVLATTTQLTPENAASVGSKPGDNEELMRQTSSKGREVPRRETAVTL